MPSINEISIAVNDLFKDITNSITIRLSKSNLLNKYRNLYFKYTPNYEFEFSSKPIFRFDNSLSLITFLEREKQLSIEYIDFENKLEIEELIKAYSGMDTLDAFYLDYSIEINKNEITILFKTNSLVFKYEVIG